MRNSQAEARKVCRLLETYYFGYDSRVVTYWPMSALDYEPNSVDFTYLYYLRETKAAASERDYFGYEP